MMEKKMETTILQQGINRKEIGNYFIIVGYKLRLYRGNGAEDGIYYISTELSLPIAGILVVGYGACRCPV